MDELLVVDERQRRLAYAEQVRRAPDVILPRLHLWNYGPCRHHSEPDPRCEFRQCGGDLWAHQRVGVSWLYLRERGVLADVTGTGKTNQIYALLALLKQRNELGGRALVVCQTPAVSQWLQEGIRWVPGMAVEAILSGMSKAERIERYIRNWDVMVIGQHMLLKDLPALQKLAPEVLVIDDVDALLTHRNKTHQALRRLSETARRCVVINATTIQIHLLQLHAALIPVGGFEVFGSVKRFETRHIRQEPREIYDTARGTKTVRLQVVGYDRLDELKRKLQPMVLRRTYKDLHDVKMPTIMPPQDIWLELHPSQRQRYEELQWGVVRLLREQGEKVEQVNALTQHGYGQRICAGLPALGEPDGPGASVKMDWLMHQLQGEFAEENCKVIVYVMNVGMVKALEQRCGLAGIGMAKVWGQESSDKVRAAEVQRFWEDPNCRVMVGTSSIERSLNLQCANIIVFLDRQINPARVTQTVGRSWRAASVHERIFIFNLLTVSTQEEKYNLRLKARQAVADYVWEEESELFEKLSPVQLLELIRP